MQMPFSKGNIIKNKVVNSNNQKIKTVYSPGIKAFVKWKRVFAFVSPINKKKYMDDAKASISLEALIVSSTFLVTIFSVISIISIVSMQNRIQISLNNCARSIAEEMYYLSEIDTVVSEIDAIENLKKYLADTIELQDYITEEHKEMVYSGAFSLYCRKKFVQDVKNEYVNKSYIVGGMSGMDFSLCRYNQNKGEVDVVIRYKMKIPFIPTAIGTFSDTKRTVIKVWNGRSIAKDSNKVYITKTGDVYHKMPECFHLNVNIKRIEYSELETVRNSGGGKYTGCKKCGIKEYASNTIIYIPESGDKFHSIITCSGLSRDVVEIDISDIGNRVPCLDCSNTL